MTVNLAVKFNILYLYSYRISGLLARPVVFCARQMCILSPTPA